MIKKQFFYENILEMKGKIMFTLIKNVHVISPEDIGIQDLLICDEKIIKVSPNIEFSWDEEDFEAIDGNGRIAVPGFLDQHVHIIGGGGENGFRSLITDVKMTDCVKSGVTTVVGLLGTDSTAKNVESLVAKARGLTEQGITAYCLTGAYNYPSPTLTGSVAKDVAFLPEVLGVKLAISDHRSSNVSKQELTRLAMDVRKAALLSGKPGVVHMHTGKGKIGLKDVIAVVKETDVPIKHFRPTHCGNLFDDAIVFGKMGGYIDFTTGIDGEICANDVLRAMEEVDFSLISMSSDSNGSMPMWNEKREIIGMGVGKMTSLFGTVKVLVQNHGMPLERAVSLITQNVAKALGLYPKKGCIAKGSDADLVLLDENLEIQTVYAKGKKMMFDKEIIEKDYYQYE